MNTHLITGLHLQSNSPSWKPSSQLDFTRSEQSIKSLLLDIYLYIGKLQWFWLDMTSFPMCIVAS